MEKCEKRRNKHSQHVNSSIAKYTNDDEKGVDNCQKYRQDNDVFLSQDRGERIQSNPPMCPAMDNYFSMEYKSRKHSGIQDVSRNKCLIPSVPGESCRTKDNINIQPRNTRNPLYNKNVAIVRKIRYKTYPEENEEECKYVETRLPEQIGDSNGEEETGEEIAYEEKEDPSELDVTKDYDEEELDDRIGDESETLEDQVDRGRSQRKDRADILPRGQRVNALEDRDANFQHRRHHRQKIGSETICERRCYNTADRDPIEIPTENEDEEPDFADPSTFSSRKSAWKDATWRQGNVDRKSWCQSRDAMERCTIDGKTLLGPVHHSRRPRTTRPETEAPMKSVQLGSSRNRKCSRCRALSGNAQKTASSRNATYRLQDGRYFIKEPIGYDSEDFEETAQPIIVQRTKPRRSKHSRSPNYDQHEEPRIINDEIGAIYKSCHTKNIQEFTKDSRERAKPSNRVGKRHDRSSSIKYDGVYSAEPKLTNYLNDRA